jgi:cold shock CspA family protein
MATVISGLLILFALLVLFVLLRGWQGQTQDTPHPSAAPPSHPAVGHKTYSPLPAPSWCGGRRPKGKKQPTGHHLDAQKTIAAFDFILKSIGRDTPWQSPRKRDDYIHDLAVMLDHDDLKTASLELVGADRSVVYRHEVRFGLANGRRSVDAAQGIELPLLPPERIANYRLLVWPARQIAQYRHQLRLSWRDAEKLPERSGSRFASEHTRRVNRDRMTGQVFVSDEARRTGVVINVSAAGDYAFARDPALPLDVFLHRAQCDKPMEFRPGMKVSFIPIQVPRGVQARNIRPA